MKIDIDKLERDICAAQREADKFMNINDGGSCNFDTPCIYLGRNTAAMRNALACLDWEVTPVDGGKYWTGWWFVYINTNGQGDRRSRMAEAACDSLAAAGWQMRMYCQMD